MEDDNQLVVPPSFIALFVEPGRIKPNASHAHILQRYDFCEDLATMLVDHARTTLWRLGVAEEDVLERVQRGLLTDEAGVTPAEAEWVCRRLAELLQWGLPPAAPDSR
jgi:hypothetical protein